MRSRTGSFDDPSSELLCRAWPSLFVVQVVKPLASPAVGLDQVAKKFIQGLNCKPAWAVVFTIDKILSKGPGYRVLLCRPVVKVHCRLVEDLISWPDVTLPLRSDLLRLIRSVISDVTGKVEVR